MNSLIKLEDVYSSAQLRDNRFYASWAKYTCNNCGSFVNALTQSVHQATKITCKDCGKVLKEKYTRTSEEKEELFKEWDKSIDKQNSSC